MLQSMGWQRVRHNLATEQQHNFTKCKSSHSGKKATKQHGRASTLHNSRRLRQYPRPRKQRPLALRSAQPAQLQAAAPQSGPFQNDFSHCVW